MDHIDIKYVLLLGSRLERFRDNGNNVYNFRCPICGDSDKKKSKARGYLYPSNNTISYRCHNCGAGMSLGKFIKMIDIGMFTQYRIEKFGKPKPIVVSPEIEIPKNTSVLFDKTNPLWKCSKLININETDTLSVVKDYVKVRKIPTKYYEQLYAATNLYDISSNIERYKGVKFPEFPVLVIPFYKKDNSCDYIQCRHVITDDSARRFTTFELSDDANKIWGENNIDWTIPVYLLEGPIDAMFVNNSLAMAGVAQSAVLSHLRQYKTSNKEICICYDNDYRTNTAILKQLTNRISEGYSVVLYDKQFEWKDINDSAMKGNWSESDIQSYISNHTFHGLRAKLELAAQLRK